MTTAYTSLLGLALPVQGELSGTWGDTVNNSITSLLDTSVAGTTNVSTDTDVTLTTTTGAANTARQAILLFSGARTALRTVTAPAQSKIYTVINATTGGFSVKLVGVGPTTGVTIVAGESAVCAWNGSDFVKVSNTAGSGSFTNLTASGTVTFTGLSASQAVFTNASDELVSNAITGTGNVVMSASPTLTGTISAAAATLSGNLTLSGGTANGVAYLNGSKVVTSGSALTFDGTNLAVGTASPSGRLHVANTGTAGTTADNLAVYFSSTNRNSNVYILAKNTDGSTLNFGDGDSSTVGRISYDHASNYMAFDANGSEQMRLTSTGLGIGTSSPTGRLNVSASDTGNTVGSGAATLNITNSNEAAFGRTTNLTFSSGTGVAANTIAAITGIYTAFSSSRAGALAFSTDNGSSSFTEKMRLDSSGNLGLGVTPSAWAGGYKASQVVYGALANNGGAFTSVNQNCFYDGSNWKYIINGNATQLSTGNGTFQFNTSASGTAGNTITFTQAMTLDASGNLLVGTTSSNLSSASRGVIEVNGASTAYIGLDTGGTLRGTFYSNGSIVGLATATLPLTFGTTGGTEWGRFDSSGNLLVGTTTSSSKLTLDGTQTFRDGADSRVGTIKMASGAFQIGTNTAHEISFLINATESARFDGSGNLLVGTTTSSSKLTLDGTQTFRDGADSRVGTIKMASGAFQIGTNTAHEISFLINATESARFDGSGNLLVGTTSQPVGTSRIAVVTTGNTQAAMLVNDTYNYASAITWNKATANNNSFIEFGTEGTYTARGTITYNRGAGLVAYNTTSDYRAKDISGPVTGSGALIDSTPVYMGKMKGATQERPMFIAHETPAYAHTGVKDAVDEDGNPIYQQMDASALIPVMWAEIQSLRKRLADAGI